MILSGSGEVTVDALGFNLPVLISQIVAFLILFGLLSFVAYKPLLKMLDERANKIKESMEMAESVKQQSLHSEEEVKKQLIEASKKGQDLIAMATATSDEIRAKAQELAKKDAESLILKARDAINAERDTAIDELRREFSDLTILAAGKVIGETLDKESHKELIDKILKESQTLKKG
jgi:F-type H+-transporting ATPase subunit b